MGYYINVQCNAECTGATVLCSVLHCKVTPPMRWGGVGVATQKWLDWMGWDGMGCYSITTEERFILVRCHLVKIIKLCCIYYAHNIKSFSVFLLQLILFLLSSYCTVLFFTINLLQKQKELGLTANEWNYRMVKRDEMYKKHEARVRAEMDASLRAQKS